MAPKKNWCPAKKFKKTSTESGMVIQNVLIWCLDDGFLREGWFDFMECWQIALKETVYLHFTIILTFTRKKAAIFSINEMFDNSNK